MPTHHLCVLCTGLALVAAIPSANAATRTWNGASNASFFSPTRWSPAGVPAPEDQLFINSGLAITYAFERIDIGSTGTLVLTGPTAALGLPQFPNSWLAPQICVGSAGNGRLLVQGGADLATMSTEIGNLNATGEAVVQGAGSTWTIGVTHFRVGHLGVGTLKVLDEAFVDYFSELDIGWGSGSVGTVIIDNASLKTGSFHLSEGGSGFLVVRNGGLATSEATFVGCPLETNGYVQVVGPNTILKNLGDSHGCLVIGKYGNGQVIVGYGGRIENSRDLLVGDDRGRGTLSVMGAASRVVNGGAVRAGASGKAGGSALLRLQSGGQITAGSELLLQESARLSIMADPEGAGLLLARGSANLSGTLEFALAPGYNPPVGTTWQIISAESISGRFSNFISDYPLSVVYGQRSVEVQLVPEPALSAWLLPLALLGRRRQRTTRRA